VRRGQPRRGSIVIVQRPSFLPCKACPGAELQCVRARASAAGSAARVRGVGGGAVCAVVCAPAWQALQVARVAGRAAVSAARQRCRRREVVKVGACKMPPPASIVHTTGAHGRCAVKRGRKCVCGQVCGVVAAGCVGAPLCGVASLVFWGCKCFSAWAARGGCFGCVVQHAFMSLPRKLRGGWGRKVSGPRPAYGTMCQLHRGLGGERSRRCVPAFCRGCARAPSHAKRR